MTIRMVAMPSGILIMKHQRQEALLVKAPPINGPITADMLMVAIIPPTNIGRRRMGTLSRRRMMEPEKTPAQPTPWIARPTMIVAEF
jgi:hypothetical protein